MSSAAEKPWTQEQFLDWAVTQEGRYEFDGIRPIAMTGGNAGHNRICHNIYLALGNRLRGTGCSSFGPDLGMSTGDNAVRYPDALITCTKFPDTDRLAPNVLVVFEVLSPSSGREDRIIKLREYHTVASIQHYVIVESTSAALTVLQRQQQGSWMATAFQRVLYRNGFPGIICRGNLNSTRTILRQRPAVLRAPNKTRNAR